MKHHIRSKWFTLFALGLVLVLAALLLPGRAWAHGPSDGGASTDDINGLFTIIFWLAVPVFLLVEGLIAYAIWSSIRRRRARDEDPEQIEGSRPLELTWTIVSFIIVGIVFILSYRFMATEYAAEADQEDTTPDLTVHVTGYMFNWDFEYYRNDGESPGDDTEVTTTRELTIPANRNVLLEISSRDVQHSFWVPELSGKVDAIPGYTNTMWLNVDDPGHYTGNCAEYCGTSHWNMLIDVQVLEPAEFDMWLAEQESAAEEFVPVGQDLTSELPQGNAEDGEETFSDVGCAACHGEQPGAGPALPQIAGHAQKEADEQGYESPGAYLRESILEPCAHEFDGYNCQVMPGDFGDRLSAQMLADIIAYLESYE